MSSLRQLVLLAAVAVAAAAAGPVARVNAQSGDFLTVKSANVGFGGQFKTGFWQPVRVTLQSGSQAVRGRLEVACADGDQLPVIYANEHAAELNLPAGQETTAALYAKSGPITAPLVLQLRADGRVVWRQELGLPTLGATQELVVGLGPSADLAVAAKTLKRSPDAGIVALQVTAAGDLPADWWGYAGVDSVVLATSDAAFLGSLTNAQRTALLDWVKLGGRIVLLVGAQGEQFAAAGSPWADLLPGELEEVVPLRERSGLEAFTRTELPFEAEFFQRQRPQMTRLKNVRGEILFGETSNSTARPLAVRRTVGFGEALFVALDLDHPSLAAWEGRPRLVATLIQRAPDEAETDEGGPRRGASHLGYSDLTGQLRYALEQFPGVSLVNFTTVAVLTIVYLLLIGPADYLLLSRTGWPRHWTWLTFPLVAALAAVAFGYIGRQAHGSRVRLNQVEIIDVDAQRQLVRGTAWTHLYSPTTAHYDAQLQVSSAVPLADAPRGWLTWQGQPGEALGGLSSRQVVLATPEPYRVLLPGERPAIERLPLAVASSKSLTARWWARSALTVESRLALDEFGLLGGEFVQPLPVELSECVLAHGEKLFRLGALKPGQRAVIDPQRGLNLEWRLTERRVEQTKDVATPWNPAATDVPQIVQMLMFQQAAGGRHYTGLSHAYQPELDLSEHVRQGRAIFVGRAKEPGARLVNEGKPLGGTTETMNWIWYRLILPVAEQPTR